MFTRQQIYFFLKDVQAGEKRNYWAECSFYWAKKEEWRLFMEK